MIHDLSLDSASTRNAINRYFISQNSSLIKWACDDVDTKLNLRFKYKVSRQLRRTAQTEVLGTKGRTVRPCPGAVQTGRGRRSPTCPCGSAGRADGAIPGFLTPPAQQKVNKSHVHGENTRTIRDKLTCYLMLLQFPVKNIGGLFVSMLDGDVLPQRYLCSV